MPGRGRHAGLLIVAVIAASGVAHADPAGAIARARAHFDDLDYELVLDDVAAVTDDPASTPGERAAALFLRGSALVVLDRPLEASAAFDAALAADASFRAPAEAPPRIRAAFESARAAWRVRMEEDVALRHGEALREVQLVVEPPARARGGRPLTVRLRLADPHRLAGRLVLGYRRDSERDYSLVSAPAAPVVDLAIPGAVLAAEHAYRLAWYVHAEHASGAVLRREHDDDAPGWIAVAAGQVPRPPPITRRWWFWTGLGALAVSAVVVPVVVLRSRDVGPQRIEVGP